MLKLTVAIVVSRFREMNVDQSFNVSVLLWHPLAPSLPLRRDSLRFLTHGFAQAVGFEDLHPAAEAQHPPD